MKRLILDSHAQGSMADFSGFETDIKQGGTNMTPVTVLPSLVAGALTPITPSANFASAPTATPAHSGGAGAPYIIKTAAQRFDAAGVSVAETIVGFVINASGGGAEPKLFVAFDRPIVVPAGLALCSLFCSWQFTFGVGTMPITDQSTAAFAGV